MSSTNTTTTSPVKEGATLPVSSTPKTTQEKDVTRAVTPSQEEEISKEPNDFQSSLVMAMDEQHNESEEVAVSNASDVYIERRPVQHAQDTDSAMLDGPDVFSDHHIVQRTEAVETAVPNGPDVFGSRRVVTRNETDLPEIEEVRTTDSTEPKISAETRRRIVHLAGAYVVIGTYLGQLLHLNVAYMRSPEDILSTVLLYDALKHFARLTTKFEGLATLELKDTTVQEGNILLTKLRIDPFVFHNLEKQWTKIIAHGRAYLHADMYNELTARPPLPP